MTTLKQAITELGIYRSKSRHPIVLKALDDVLSIVRGIDAPQAPPLDCKPEEAVRFVRQNVSAEYWQELVEALEGRIKGTAKGVAPWNAPALLQKHRCCKCAAENYTLPDVSGFACYSCQTVNSGNE